MRKFFAVAMGSMVALAGFAGAANASATVDLIWIDISNTDTNGNAICLRAAKRNCPQIGTTLSNVAVTDSITLGVIITAGPNGISSAGVSVFYGDAAPKLVVTDFQRLATTQPFPYLPSDLGTITDVNPGWIENINAAGGFPLAGIGLPAGNTAYLGTVTFHKTQLVNGTFNIDVNVDGPVGTDDIASTDPLVTISDTVTFNGATLINVPEPGALSLLAMGLGGMLLAGRGRRS